MNFIKGSFFFLTLLALSACGGGSGSSSSDQAQSSNVSASATSIDIKSAYLYRAETSFLISLKEAPVQSYYSYLVSDRDESLIYETSINEISDTQVEYIIKFQTGRELGYGFHTEKLSVLYCYDEDCNQAFEGMPLDIQLNIEVANHGKVVSDVQNITVRNPLSDEISLPEVSVTIDVEGGVEDSYYLRYEDEKGLVVPGYLSGELPITLSTRLKADYILGDGVYTTNLNVIACYDSACDYPVEGSLSLPITYIIEDDSNVSSGYEVTSLLVNDRITLDNVGFDEVHQRIVLLENSTLIDTEKWSLGTFNNLGLPLSKISTNGVFYVENADTDQYETYELVNNQLVLQNSAPRVSGIGSFEEGAYGDYFIFSRAESDNRFRILDINTLNMIETEDVLNACSHSWWVSPSTALTYGCYSSTIFLTHIQNASVSVEQYSFAESLYSCDTIPLGMGISSLPNGFESMDACGQKVVGSNGVISREPRGLPELENVSIVSAYEGAVLVKDKTNCGYYSSGQYITCEYRILILNETFDQVITNIPYSSSLAIREGEYYEPEKIIFSETLNQIYLFASAINGGVAPHQALKIQLQ